MLKVVLNPASAQTMPAGFARTASASIWHPEIQPPDTENEPGSSDQRVEAGSFFGA